MLFDSRGNQVRASVDRVGAGTWALFPDSILLEGGEAYQARLLGGICDVAGNCTAGDVVWTFTVAKDAERAAGDTSILEGFLKPSDGFAPAAPVAILTTVRSSKPRKPAPKETTHVTKPRSSL
jgi:hypothetical protein